MTEMQYADLEARVAYYAKFQHLRRARRSLVKFDTEIFLTPMDVVQAGDWYVLNYDLDKKARHTYSESDYAVGRLLGRDIYCHTPVGKADRKYKVEIVGVQKPQPVKMT